MKAELPFELTPITLRYLRELAIFANDFYTDPFLANPQGAGLKMYRYKGGEQPTFKTELNVNDFLEHLQSLGAISVEYPDKKDIVALHYSNLDESLCYPQYCWVHILKSEPIHELLEDAEKRLAEKKKKGKVEWDVDTATLKFRDKTCSFHTKGNAPKFNAFKTLWYERQAARKKGRAVSIKELAERSKVYDELLGETFDDDAKKRTRQLVKDIKVSLKGFPLKIETRGNTFLLKVEE